MAKKKKKKKKTSPAAQSQLQNLSFKELIERGERFIGAGRPRDAISVLRFALKKHGQTDETTRPLFRAYLARAGQLREKGMEGEAHAVKKTAEDYLPPMADLSPADMAVYLAFCTDREAFDLYLSYVQIHGVQPAADRILADRLVKGGGWEALAPLDDDLPLKRDSEVVRPAVDAMAEGRWETALEMLKPVPRTSPFAPVRLFCRAMAAFYDRDDAAARAAFSRIPEDFFLRPAARDLQTALAGDGESPPGRKAGALARLDCIWDVPVHLPAVMQEVIRHLENERLQEARKGLQAAADALLPSDPDGALFAMLQALWRMVLEGRLPDYAHEKLVKTLLPKKRADLLLSKTAVMDDMDHPYTAMGDYLKRIDLEFPEDPEQSMARAVILEGLARLGATDRFERVLQADASGLRAHRSLFGVESDPSDAEMIPIELALESIRVDPENRTAYELLAQLPRGGRAAKNAVEKGLLAMIDRFPGDPYPHLELARLYYDKSAFRKAERVLGEALAQAPHDPRVVEKNALACLIAAEKNLGRDKLHLVERDMDRAGDFDAKKLAPYITEKRMLLRLHRGESPDDFLDEMLEDRTLFEQIRTLVVLIMDLKHRAFRPKNNHFRKLDLALDRRLGDGSRLAAEEAARLLMPLDRSLLRIYDSLQTAPILLSRKPDLLKWATDADAIGLYDRILSEATMDVVKKDIKRRKKKAQKNHGTLLSFIQEVLRQIEKRDFKSKPLLNLRAEASGPLEEELRGLSRRLAPFAPQPLKEALEMFRFEILDRPPFSLGGFFDGFDGFDDFDDFEDDDLFEDEDLFDDEDVPVPSFFDPEEMGQLEELVQSMERMQRQGIPLDIVPRDMIQGMVDELEDLVDELGIRDQPEGMILTMRDMMELGGPFKRGMKLMGRFMNLAGGRSHLSREARILLYGKQKGKKS